MHRNQYKCLRGIAVSKRIMWQQFKATKTCQLHAMRHFAKIFPTDNGNRAINAPHQCSLLERTRDKR